MLIGFFLRDDRLGKATKENLFKNSWVSIH